MRQEYAALLQPKLLHFKRSEIHEPTRGLLVPNSGAFAIQYSLVATVAHVVGAR